VKLLRIVDGSIFHGSRRGVALLNVLFLIWAYWFIVYFRQAWHIHDGYK